jgi:hypothetical protein
MSTLISLPTRQATLSLPFPHGRRKVPVNQIVRLEGQQNYTHCFFSNGRSLLVARTLKVLLDRLPADALIRLHRKHAVNPDYVTDWNNREGCVQLRNGETFTISRRRSLACRAYRNRSGYVIELLPNKLKPDESHHLIKRDTVALNYIARSQMLMVWECKEFGEMRGIIPSTE